jgi:hypothetical protein
MRTSQLEASMGAQFSADDPDWVAVGELLPKDRQQLAVDHGFLSADNRGDEKEISVDIKLRMMLCLAANSLSLRTTAALFAAAHVVSVSHVALHHWFKKGSGFLSAVMAALVQANQVFAPDRWAGYRVRAVDATTVQKPGAKGTTARVHYMLELNSMLVPEVYVTDEKRGETFRNFKIEPGSLNLGDRGYSNARSIAAVVDRKADILVRWNWGSTPLTFKQGRKVDALRLARSVQVEGEPQEWAVCVARPLTSRENIGGRLIIVKLPARKAAEARERLRKTSDSPPTRKSLFLAGYVMLFSTVPSERLTKELLVELYRLRWQIELEFKREKSIGELDALPNYLPTTAQSWILAKLVSAELSKRLFFRPEKRDSANNGTSGSSRGDNSTSGRTSDLLGPLHSHAPWEMRVMGQQILRRCLLAIPKGYEALANFGRRFVLHLHKAKLTGSKRRSQVAHFLEQLHAAQVATA